MSGSRSAPSVAGMSANPNSREDAGGTGLLLVVSFATILVVATEGVFIAYATWWALPLLLLGVIIMAGVVIGAVIRTIDDGSLAGGSPRREEVEPAPVAEPARPFPRVVAGH